MTTYNKLKIAILSIIASQNLYAINVDPAVIQSATGELLYAEINFRQANRTTPLEISLAKPEDLDSIGASHQPPAGLNFFTRYNSDGSGVITITSSRPITASDLDFVVKIKDSSTTRLQHIKTPLKRNTNTQSYTSGNEKTLSPIMIVNEKDIALNLPLSSSFSAPPPMGPPVITTTQSIVVPSTQPQISQNIPSAVVIQTAPSNFTQNPVVTSSSHTSESKTISKIEPVNKTIPPTATTQVSQQTPAPQVAPLIAQKTDSTDPLVKKFSETQQDPKELLEKHSQNTKDEPTKNDLKSSDIKAKNIKPKKAQTLKPEAHIVKNNESLWTIATRIANQEHRSVSDVMQQIKVNNEHAFIKGDVNRLKRGATLNLTKLSNQKDEKNSVKNTQSRSNSKQTNKAKYRLDQAEMSLVTDSQQHSANGTSPKTKNGQNTLKELSSKVMTSREKTVKLQRNVTQLEVALNQKDHRIQLLNARLAQLQQQLKNQQAAKKSQN